MSKEPIIVFAGVNSAGKSSVISNVYVENLPYFNPDDVARRIQEKTGCTAEEANARAWEKGRQRLEDAIENGTMYIFETTLGGNTIPAMLRQAAEAGREVFIWFVGLSSPELHLQRVRARVAAGGHDIPEEKIRERWEGSRRNIIELMPFVTELRVFDNSEEGDPSRGTIPAPGLLLHWVRGEGVVAPAVEEIAQTPEWAKPIVARALKLQRS